MPDERIAYCTSCTWWDSIQNVAKTSSGLPCCPHCGSTLYEMRDEKTWLESIDAYEKQEHPGYRQFMEWLRGKCFKNQDLARIVYEAEKKEAEDKQKMLDGIEFSVSNGYLEISFFNEVDELYKQCFVGKYNPEDHDPLIDRQWLCSDPERKRAGEMRDILQQVHCGAYPEGCEECIEEPGYCEAKEAHDLLATIEKEEQEPIHA